MHVSAEEQSTAAYQIFNSYFPVRVQNKFLYTDNYLSKKGIVSISPMEAVKEMESMRTTVATITELAGYRHEGASIELVNIEDAARIYNLIVRHLNDWYTVVASGFYDRLPPAGDLFILDELASELHVFVARRKMRELNDGLANRQLGKSFLGNNRPQEQYSLDKVQPYKNKAPAIINKAGSYYGTKEFGTQF